MSTKDRKTYPHDERDERTNLSPEELEQLGATFMRFLSNEMEHDSSNWKEFYTILDEACKAKEAAETKSKVKAGQKKEAEPKSSHGCSQQNGFKVNTEATKQQYKTTDYSQKQSATFKCKFSNKSTKDSKLKSDHPNDNGIPQEPTVPKPKKSNKNKCNKKSKSDAQTSFEPSSSKHNINNTHKKQGKSSAAYKEGSNVFRADSSSSSIYNNTIPNARHHMNNTHPTVDSNRRLIDMLEQLNEVFSKGFHILKQTFFYVCCLILMVLMISLKFAWHVLIFLLKVTAFLLLWLVLNFVQLCRIVNAKYGIFSKIKYSLSTTAELFHLITGIDIARKFQRRANRSSNNFGYDDDDDDDDVEVPTLPTTSEEAIKHLIQQKESRPFRTLCITRQASDNDIKINYRKLALLVHPDKCDNEQSDEAFKVLDTAFRKISDPSKREEIVQEAERQRQWKEFNKTHGEDFQKMFEEIINTIPCAACNGKHKRTLIKERNFMLARYCADCNKRHAANDGDLWAETYRLGFGWVCYVCMDGEIYEVTEWARCQKLCDVIPANSHLVPCRLGTAQSTQRKSSKKRAAEESDTSGSRRRKGRKGRKGK